MDFVAGINIDRVEKGTITLEQTTVFETTFATAFGWLSKNYPTKAKIAIAAVTVDGTLVTEELKADVMDIFSKYGF